MEAYIPNDLVIKYGRVSPKDIGYVNSIVEAYEGIGQVRTVDHKKGIIVFWIMPDSESVMDKIIEDLHKETGLIILEGYQENDE